MRIVICGYYGFSNAGDDAILMTSIPLIRAVHSDCQISVVTYPGADLDGIYRSTGLTAIDGADIAHVDQIIAAADLVLIGGGGLVQDYLPSDRKQIGRSQHGNLTFWLSLGVIAHAHGVPVSTWMIGIGPLTTDDGREDASLLLGMMQTVSVRDDASAALARDLNVDPDRILIGSDPVFTLETPRPDRGDAPTVGVVLRNWDGISGWLSPIAEALDTLVSERAAQIRLIPFQTGRGGSESDDLVAVRLAARMNSTDTCSVDGIGADLSELAILIAGCDAVLGMRLHSLVFAAAAGVPTVGLSYDPKVTHTMARLGRSEFVTDLDSPPDRDWMAERLRAALDEGVGTNRPDGIIDDLRGASYGVLRSEATTPALPTGLVSALVASLAISAAENSSLSSQLASAERNLEERGTYLNDRVAELQQVRSEFQAFRDARAVKLAQIAWDGRRIAADALSSITKRSTGEKAKHPAMDAVAISEIVSANADTAGFVVFAPSIHWDVQLFQRPQQMASAFARQGYTVLYLVDEQYRNGLTGFRSVADGIFEGYLEDAQIDQMRLVPSPVFMSYVYNYAWGKHLANARTVYEHIDDLEVFEQVYGRHDLERWHTDALHHADLVVGSATDLMSDLTPVRPDAILVPNGVDMSHFEPEDRPVPADIADLVESGTPIVGYYGALAEWFDYNLLREVAARLTDHTFVLIGPDYDGTLPKSGILDLENVRWLGAKPYGELPAYLDRFTVATIPFIINDVTHSVSPLKLFEYMAGGKPVITPPLRECAKYQGVLIADGADEWTEMIELAQELGAGAAYANSLREIAGANTWDARVRAVLDGLAVLA